LQAQITANISVSRIGSR